MYNLQLFLEKKKISGHKIRFHIILLVIFAKARMTVIIAHTCFHLILRIIMKSSRVKLGNHFRLIRSLVPDMLCVEIDQSYIMVVD